MKRIQELQRESFPRCKPLPGVERLLGDLGRRSEVEVALATSSHQGNYELKTQSLKELMSVFPEENRVLGDDKRIPAGRGKPAPDIYLLALKTVNDRRRREGKDEVTPAECLVFEDSVPGVEAGRRAGMQAVWVPHPGLAEEMKGKEELILAGLMGEHKEIEEKNAQIGVVEHDGQARKKGAPGEVGDGWGRHLQTLEDFPYESYGIRLSV